MRRTNWFVLSVAAAVLGALCVFAGDWLTMVCQGLYAEQLEQWFADSLGAVITFPILLIAAILANRISRGEGFRAGRSPITMGMLGLVGGLGMTGLALFVLLNLKQATVISDFAMPASLAAIAAMTGIIFIQAASEEVFFRGWLQGSLEREIHPFAAIIVSALIFAGLHFLVAAEGWVAGVNLLLAGLTLGLLFRLTDGLAAPILFHFGWNWAELLGFGLTPNPGKSAVGAFSDFDLTGPEILGGGAGGLNGGIVSASLLGLLCLILFAIFFVQQRSTAPLHAASLDPSAQPEVAEGIESYEIQPEKTEPEKTEPAFSNAPAAADPNNGGNQETTAFAADQEVTLVQAITEASPSTGGTEHIATLSGTHPGAVREVNEDRLFASEEAGIWAVADGMGGHRFGDRAATLIVETLAHFPPVEGFEQRITAASDAITAANRAIYREAQAAGSRMGSTIVTLVVANGQYALIWAGDSRAYRLRDGRLQQLTRDHTQVQELVDRGELTPEEAANHPMSHVLSKAIGVVEELVLETVRGEIVANDVFFLCSDGVYQALFEDEIVEALANLGRAKNLDTLIGQAVAQGAKDNVTAIAVLPGKLDGGAATIKGTLG